MIRLGLIGCPLDHSLSPALHNAALRACGIRGDYTLFPVAPSDIKNLAVLLNQVRSGELTGLNITAPHKQDTIPLLDELTPSAHAIGAVNTIYLKQDKLVGDNTDAPGFIIDLNNFLHRSDASCGLEEETMEKSALILGAGGAARAVAYTLTNAGWTITVAARRLEQAKELVNSHWQAIPYDALHIVPLLSAFQLIVNATPVGTYPNTAASPWLNRVAFPKGAVLYDLIYNPPETQLVRQARAAGLRASTGIGMLVEQAALAFELWTGQHVSRGVMLAAISQTDR